MHILYHAPFALNSFNGRFFFSFFLSISSGFVCLLSASFLSLSLLYLLLLVFRICFNLLYLFIVIVEYQRHSVSMCRSHLLPVPPIFAFQLIPFPFLVLTLFFILVRSLYSPFVWFFIFFKMSEWQRIMLANQDRWQCFSTIFLFSIFAVLITGELAGESIVKTFRTTEKTMQDDLKIDVFHLLWSLSCCIQNICIPLVDF